MSKEKYRSRVHMLLLYPDDKSHMNALDKIKHSYDHIGILHNKDYFTADDEKSNSAHVAGTLKKAHYHVVLRFNNSVWSSAICKELGIEHNYIENVKRFDNAMQYLIHYNDYDKAQYSIEDCFGNLITRLRESIIKVEKSEGEKVLDLIQYIVDKDEYISVTEFASYCASNGYWAEFRRSGAIFCKMIEERNEQIKLNKMDQR